MNRSYYLNRKIQEIVEKKAGGSMLHCKADWHEFGEKSSKYFYNLESHNYNKKSINRLQIDNQILTDPKDIDKALSNYYRQLYMPDAKVEPDKIDTSILP